MPLVGLEPTIPVFKWANTFHALDRAATVTGVYLYLFVVYSKTISVPQAIQPWYDKMINE
jgi:hypothetical protein